MTDHPQSPRLHIDVDLAQRLVSSQFPLWAELPIEPVAVDGWDHRNFRLGDLMLVRLPSSAAYAAQVLKEQEWLPRLAPMLPVQVPKPLALGKPDDSYPLHWSVYQWIEGQTAAECEVEQPEFARAIARFLRALHQIPTTNGPPPGRHNFYRGGSLAIYDEEARTAIAHLREVLDAKAALALWEAGLQSEWQRGAVWAHGDVSAGNLLVDGGRLAGVIDFGLLAVGDPACDLVIAWTFLDTKCRADFRSVLELDDDTWSRGRAWALWKAAIITAGLTETNVVERSQARRTLDAVLEEL